MLPYDDPRFAASLRRLTGAKGFAALTQLLDVMPVVVLAGDRPEDAFLRDDRLLFAGRSVAASAGNYSSLWLENGPENQSLAVIERVDVLDNNCFVSMLPAVTIGGSGSLVFPRDGRVANQAANGLARATITAQNPAVPTPSTASARVLAGADVLPPVVVAPGSRLFFETGAVNLALAVNLWWREVPLPPPNR